MTAATRTNDYWEAVRDHLAHDGMWGVDVVDTYGTLDRSHRQHVDRFALCGQYSWTVTDPATVGFVLDHCGPLVVDPLAGTGWWAYLLGQDHVDVQASDLNPPDGDGGNHWHRTAGQHVPVARMDAVEAARQAGVAVTLLLSWPPYDSDVGFDVLNAYRGNRVIYIGEGGGGCCGTDDMFRLFDEQWNEVAEHRPVQYYGLHDYVTVYERKERN